MSLTERVLYAFVVRRGRIQCVNGLQMDKLPQSTSQLLATWRRCAVLLQRTLQVFHNNSAVDSARCLHANFVVLLKVLYDLFFNVCNSKQRARAFSPTGCMDLFVCHIRVFVKMAKCTFLSPSDNTFAVDVKYIYNLVMKSSPFSTNVLHRKRLH